MIGLSVLGEPRSIKISRSKAKMRRCTKWASYSKRYMNGQKQVNKRIDNSKSKEGQVEIQNELKDSDLIQILL